MLKEKDLNKKIERLKRELLMIASTENKRTNENVIKKSKQLDNLIVNFMKSKE
ncbi:MULTISPECIES: aspartyl-phosphate phosphatase Spo0E family protein [unclassified Candidatus Frackibacter]|uniref:aspartyl-phosphate phosphatase Spo0E family protein n=1 Tax=unclassified Candidatus Frackibacter TaxID=2648818 RepID=UPI0008830F52|nr:MULTISPECIES: aspartyl-phosphate phosphatase Spo0E family protein [unclassified Candidatus Frackibacter]SDC68336.1 Spo0E like sporulation regulatory protein [Candidatus Frackibacter sp. WG11]SEM83338.1 Spo0E like sporulation regulatory protein [Candidatus Frackibacter sp. WG12]SFL91933.1 Spo0E like sporulation regulatory protein [Candidatus Frackibacter sp. WG13]